jgi:hypothetical protein
MRSSPAGQHQLQDRPRHLRGDARHRAQVVRSLLCGFPAARR